MRCRRRRRSASKSRCLFTRRTRTRALFIDSRPRRRRVRSRPERDPCQDARLDLPEVLVVQQALRHHRLRVAQRAPQVGDGGGGAGRATGLAARPSRGHRRGGGVAGAVGAVGAVGAPVSTVPSAHRRRRRRSPARGGMRRGGRGRRFAAPATRPMGAEFPARDCFPAFPVWPTGSRARSRTPPRTLVMPGPVGLAPRRLGTAAVAARRAPGPGPRHRGHTHRPAAAANTPSGSSGTVRRTPRAGPRERARG